MIAIKIGETPKPTLRLKPSERFTSITQLSVQLNTSR